MRAPGACYAGLAYDSIGSGPAVLLLHGLSYDRRIWSPFVTQLVPNYRCIAVDLPGHGESPDLDSPDAYHPVKIADRLHALVEHLGAGRPLVIGHSLGGALATFYAAAVSVRGVINIDQSLRLGPMATAIQHLRQELSGPGFDTVWAQMRSGFGIESLPEQARALEQMLSHPRRNIVLGFWDILLNSEADALQAYVDAALGRIGAPYVSFHGTDPGSGYQDWLRARTKSAQLVYHPGAGHFPHFVDPGELIGLIRDFAPAK